MSFCGEYLIGLQPDYSQASLAFATVDETTV